MNGYAKTAIAAQDMLARKQTDQPRAAWDAKLCRADKVCPRTVFLALCEAGEVVGVPAAPCGSYAPYADENREVALVMVRILREGGPTKPFPLWNAAQRRLGRDTCYEEQADVVLGLWNACLIREGGGES